MKALTKSNKLRAFIAPKMTDLVTLLDNNRKSTVYTGGDIHGIYHYLNMIGSPTTLTASVRRSHHFRALSSIKNDASYLRPVIAALRTRRKSICECCGRIGGQTPISPVWYLSLGWYSYELILGRVGGAETTGKQVGRPLPVARRESLGVTLGTSGGRGG